MAKLIGYKLSRKEDNQKLISFVIKNKHSLLLSQLWHPFKLSLLRQEKCIFVQNRVYVIVRSLGNNKFACCD